MISPACTADCVPVSFRTFIRVKRWLRVHRAGKYFGRFDCNQCLRRRQIPFLQAKVRNPAQFVKLGLELRDCTEHMEVMRQQRDEYRARRNNLQPGELLLLMDFTSFSLEPDPEETEQRMIYVQDLVLVLEFIENGQRHTEYVDYICDCPDSNTNDYHFVLCAMLLFFRTYYINEAFKLMEIWTDGGPKHFKTRYCQWMWHALSCACFDHKLIAHNFFASYHGHSLADAHAAVDKRLVRTAYNTSELSRKTVGEEAINWGPSSASALVPLFDDHAARTIAFHIPFIPRDAAAKPKIAGINLIKSKHRFEYAEGTCLAFQRTGQEVGTPFEFKYL